MKVLACLVLVGCSSMYGGPAERLAKPPTRIAPIVEHVPPRPIKYVETCNVDFRATPASIQINHELGKSLVAQADKTMNDAKTKPTPLDAANTVRDAIDRYGNALRKDPFDPEATLKLALAYDQVYRKGCALALLKRLAALDTNPKFKADPVIGRVLDNTWMFEGYRNEAVTAVGR